MIAYDVFKLSCFNMKIFLLFLTLIVNANFTFSQQREKLKESTFNSAKFHDFEIKVTSKSFDGLNLNFPGTYSFIDNRADKSKLGFITCGDDNSLHNFKFPGEAETYLNGAIAKLGKKQEVEQKILIVIRNLWLSQIVIPYTLLKQMKTSDMKGF